MSLILLNVFLENKAIFDTVQFIAGATLAAIQDMLSLCKRTKREHCLFGPGTGQEGQVRMTLNPKRLKAWVAKLLMKSQAEEFVAAFQTTRQPQRPSKT